MGGLLVGLLAIAGQLAPRGAEASEGWTDDVSFGLHRAESEGARSTAAMPGVRLAATAPESILLAQAGHAGAAAAGAQPAAWHFALGAYLWMPRTETTLTVGSLSRSTTIDFSDIFENLDFALTGHFEATWQRWTAFLDFMYLEIGIGETVNGVRVDLDVEQLFFELGGTYRLVDVPAGAGRFTIEALAGGRLMALDVNLGVAGQRSSKDAAVVDPIIGGRIAYHVTDTIALWFRGDVGGFGVGSELTWNLIAGVNWRFVPWASAFAGWRFMDINLEKDLGGPNPLDIELTLTGPFLGINFYF